MYGNSVLILFENYKSIIFEIFLLRNNHLTDQIEALTPLLGKVGQLLLVSEITPCSSTIFCIYMYIMYMLYMYNLCYTCTFDYV